jgi:pimeloyl-ACP methyl ester carboxylesterase
VPTVEVNGVRLAYELTGSGRPLVMIAGRGQPAEWWHDGHVQRYVDAGYRVLTYDNRGMPPSGCPDLPYHLDDFVADTAALLDHLGDGSYAVIGHSMGSCIAQELAAQRPDLVDVVAMLATTTRQPAWIEAFHRGALELFASGCDVSDQLLVGALFGQAYDPDGLTDDDAVRPFLDAMLTGPRWTDPGRSGQWSAYAEYRGSLEALASVRAPTLVLAFERDLIMPPVLAREVAHAIPGSRYREMPGAGHWGWMLDPDTAHAIVLDYLAEVAPT